MNIKKALSCTVFLIWFDLQAQELPAIIPPSPEASALFKYLDYPVSYATGIPEVSIPIYEVRSGELSVPISISYHASGRKVYDQDGSVALGWTLNAGGIISRTTYGDVDFGTFYEGEYKFPSTFKLENDINIRNDFEYLAGIENYEKFRQYGPGVQYWYDSEYDIFSYSFGQNSGHLVFKDDNGVKTPVLIPMKPYQVEWGGETLGYINIIDDKGVFYKFSVPETHGAATSSWGLSQIISADKADTIEFKYGGVYQERSTYTTNYQLTDAWNITGGTGDNLPPVPPGAEDPAYNVQRTSYTVRRITEIRFKHGKVIFNYYPDGSLKEMLKDIQVLDRNNEIIKIIKFEQSSLDQLSDGLPPTHKLDQLIFSNKDGINKETYSFEYYPTVSSPISVQAQDFWGYYNANTSQSMVPYFENIDFIYNGQTDYIDIGSDPSNGLPNLEATKSGVLKKITYPTGGSTEFNYHLNKYFDSQSQQMKDCGGLRIYQIKTMDGKGNTYYKTYKYGEEENGYGFIAVEPVVEHLAYENRYVYFGVGQFSPYKGGTYRHRVFTPGFLPDLGFLASKPIIYPEVTEYHGTESVNTGKTIYKYNYRLVTPLPLQVQQGSAGEIPGIAMSRFHVAEFNLWDNPLLEYKIDFKNTGQSGNPYQLVKQVYNQYQKVEEPPITGLHVVRTYVFPQDGTAVEYDMYADKYAAEYYPEPPKIYGYGNYNISVGSKNLEKTIETTFTDAGVPITQVTNYSYNDKQLISQTEKIINASETLITEIKYPFEDLTKPVHQQMVTRNMVNYVVEQNTYKNTTPLQSVKTSYKVWNPDVIAPEELSTRQGTLPFEPRVSYHQYDDWGNLTSVSKANDKRISYLYGYEHSLPIAQIQGASEKDFFHTSFEDEGEGNSGVNDSKTGHKSRINGYQKTIENLTNGTYILSYWKKSGSIWNFIENKNIPVTNGTYNINLSGQVDEIRFYPQAALITTYTYDPLVGITSSTDQNGLTNYFQYDSYGRLKSAKDHNGNILQDMYYHYQE